MYLYLAAPAQVPLPTGRLLISHLSYKTLYPTTVEVLLSTMIQPPTTTSTLRGHTNAIIVSAPERTTAILAVAPQDAVPSIEIRIGDPVTVRERRAPITTLGLRVAVTGRNCITGLVGLGRCDGATCGRGDGRAGRC